MKIEIKNRWNLSVIHSGDYMSIYEAVAGAIKANANLCDANLCDAKNAELAIAKTRILLEGELIGWKKLSGGLIAKLRIPELAKRSHAFGRKCRCSEAVVVAIYKGDTEALGGFSSHDMSFKYVKGEIVKPKEPSFRRLAK
jgi:hypothetical protein